MATDREASFPIENWDGVNLNVDSEDLTPSQLLAAQNLWEKTIGQLETRWGSKTLAYRPDGVKEGGFGRNFKVYKSWGESKRFARIQCEPDVGAIGSLPDGIELSFENDPIGFWNNTNTFSASESGITLNMNHRRLIFRLVGYGVDKMLGIAPSDIAGYSSGTNQRLVVTVTSDFVLGTSVTGMEIYATVACGQSMTYTTPTGVSDYQEQSLWCGFVDLTEGEQVKNFYYSPAGFNSTVSAGTAISSTKRSFIVRGFQTGTNGVTGEFLGGKTVYVCVLPQWSVFSAGALNRCVYRNVDVDVFGGNITPITIPGSTTGYITVSSILPNTTSFVIFVGETPQTLQPVGLFNNSTLGNIATDVPDVITPGTYWIQKPTKNNPGVADITYKDLGIADVSFRFSDYSRQDMFMGVDNDGVVNPIFCSRLFAPINSMNLNGDVIGELTTASAQSVNWMWYSVNAMGSMQRMGDGASYQFTHWLDYSLFVNDFDPLTLQQTVVSGITYFVIPHRTSSNYFICDGAVAAPVIEDGQFFRITNATSEGAGPTVQTSQAHAGMIGKQARVVSGTNFVAGGNFVVSVVPGVSVTFLGNVTSGVGSNGLILIDDQLTLPNMKYIHKFDGSVVLSGGSKSIDPRNGKLNDSSKVMYFSRADNPFNFTIPGASSSVHQTIIMDDDGENISGIGTFSINTSDSGPRSQLMVVKKSATWVMSGLPSADQGSLVNFTNSMISSKVGGFHNTISNTPIGTLMASADNVYLMRDSGEPSPIGQCISPLLVDANMSNAQAVYHDKHYKLSFSHPDYPGFNDGKSNNVEMWLNINKSIEKKGAEDWVGPMIGRSVDFCFVEDKDDDGIIYNQARDRIAIDNYQGGGRIYAADFMPNPEDGYIYDLIESEDGVDQVVSSFLETKDFEVTSQDNNWSKLIKRIYIKSRQNAANSEDSSRYQLFVDGEDASGILPFDFNSSSGNFYKKPLSLRGIFPPGRINGRVLRLRFLFSHRIGIGGLQVNYQINRRRL